MILLDVHVGAEDGLELLDEVEALDLPVRVVLLSGSSEVSAGAALPGRRRARQAVRARTARVGRRRPDPPVGSLADERHRRSDAGASTRIASRATSSSARRKAARSASARRRPPSRRRSSSATAISSRSRSSTSCARRRSAAGGDERELLYRLRKTCESGIVAAELAAREDELENRILAARVDWRGEELPLRSAQAKLAVLPEYGDRDELGLARERGERALQRRPPRAARRRRGARGGALGRAGRDRPQRRGEGDLAARARARARRGRARLGGRLRDAARALVREAARPGARGRADLEPHELPAPALAARADLHEGARRRGLRRHAERARPRHREHARASGSTSTTGRRSRRGPA